MYFQQGLWDEFLPESSLPTLNDFAHGFQGPEIIQAVRVRKKDAIDIFEIKHLNEWFVIPMCYLDSADETLVKFLQSAFFKEKFV